MHSLDKELQLAQNDWNRTPSDPQACLRVSSLFSRAGLRAQALEALEVFQEFHPDAEIQARIDELLKSGKPSKTVSLTQLGEIDAPRGSPAILSLAFNVAENLVAAGTRGGDLVVYSGPPEEPPQQVGRIPRGVTALCFGVDSKSLLGGGGDQSVRRYALPAKKSTKGEFLARDLEGYILGVSSYGGGVAASSFFTRWVKHRSGEEFEDVFSENGVVAPSRLWCRKETADKENQKWSYQELPNEQGVVFPGCFGHQILGTREVEVVLEPGGRGAGLLSEKRLDTISPAGERKTYQHKDLYPVKRPFREDLSVVALAPWGRAFLAGSLYPYEEEEEQFGPYQKGAKLYFLGETLEVVDLLLSEAITAVAFSPSGGKIALGSLEGKIWLADVLEGYP